MAGSVIIRPLGEDEREAWNPLWAGYLAFYKSALAQEISDLAWSRFHDPDEPLFALGGYVDGRLSGIAHYLFHRSTWAYNRYCYLEDLFVARTYRGSGAARALIEGVYAEADRRGADSVYWHTQSYNAPARSLYDQVAQPTSFVVYER